MAGIGRALASQRREMCMSEASTAQPLTLVHLPADAFLHPPRDAVETPNPPLQVTQVAPARRTGLPGGLAGASASPPAH